MFRRSLPLVLAMLCLAPVAPAGADVLAAHVVVGTFNNSGNPILSSYCVAVVLPSGASGPCSISFTVTSSTVVPVAGGCAGVLEVGVTLNSPGVPPGRTARDQYVVIADGVGVLTGLPWDYNPGYLSFAAVMRVPTCEASPAIPVYDVAGTFVNVDPYS